MTMSLFHNLKLKRRKVDSRSSSDGSEVAVTDMISPPSLASSSEVSTDDNAHSRPSPGFEVEVKPNKFELSAPRYTSWASPAKLKQEPIYGDETISATVVPKVFANGLPAPTSTTLPTSSTTTSIESSVHMHNGRQLMHAMQGGHRLADALRPPPSSQPAVTTMVTAAHLPLAAAAAAAKLQAMHPNMVTSSSVSSHHLPMHQHQHHPGLRMMHVQPTPSKLSPAHQVMHTTKSDLKPMSVVQSPVTNGPYVSMAPMNHQRNNVSVASSMAQQRNNGGVMAGGGNSGITTSAGGNANNKPPGPSVILGEHGGVKTMIWTDSTTYWQSAATTNNKFRQHNNGPSPHPPVVSSAAMLPLPPMPAMQTSVTTEARGPTNMSLKVERADNEQLKMSSAVDGLLSLSSQGHPMQPMMTSSGGSPSNPSPGPGITDLKMANFPQVNHSGQMPPRRRSPMNMERLWAGDMSQLPSHVIESQNGHMNMTMLRPGHQLAEDEEPLLCNICEDRATGLHYGIITCEG